MNKHLGGYARLASFVIGMALGVTVLTGCADAQSMVPLAPLTDSSARAQVTAQTQADRLVRMLQALEDRFTLEPATPARGRSTQPSAAPVMLTSTATVTEAPEQLSAYFNLASQARAFVQAQAAYLEDCAVAVGGPAEVTVEATEVEVVGTDIEGAPVARVVIETTYRSADGPDTVSSAGYAVSWAPGSNVDADGRSVKGTHFDGMRLTSVLPLYGQADSPALDSGLGTRSPSNAVHTYVRAITHGSSTNISALEGTVRSSDDFRAVLKERLTAGPRYTVVEVPVAQTGAAHVLFVIQEEVPGALRLDVILGTDGPTVVPRL